MLWNHGFQYFPKLQLNISNSTDIIGSFLKHESMSGSLRHDWNISNCATMSVLYSVLVLQKNNHRDDSSYLFLPSDTTVSPIFHERVKTEAAFL